MSSVKCDKCGALGECKGDCPQGWKMTVYEAHRMTIYDEYRTNQVLVNQCVKYQCEDCTKKDEDK